MKIKRGVPCRSCGGTGIEEVGDPRADARGKTGRNSPETSHAAAREIRPKTGTQRASLGDYIFDCADGATDQMARDEIPMNPDSVRPRRNELIEDGWIQDSGRTLPHGVRNAETTVWEFVPARRQAWLSMSWQ